MKLKEKILVTILSPIAVVTLLLIGIPLLITSLVLSYVFGNVIYHE